jgi:hypothetical protein
MLVAGAILVALLALATERSFTLIERRSVSRGLRGPTMPVETEVLNLPRPVESAS